MKARPAVQRGMALGLELRQGIDMKDPKVRRCCSASARAALDGASAGIVA